MPHPQVFTRTIHPDDFWHFSQLFPFFSLCCYCLCMEENKGEIRFFNFMIAHSLPTPHSKLLWKYSSKNILSQGWSHGSFPTAGGAKTQPFWPFRMKLWHDVARGLQLLIPFMERISLGILQEAKIRIMHTELCMCFAFPYYFYWIIIDTQYYITYRYII